MTADQKWAAPQRNFGKGYIRNFERVRNSDTGVAWSIYAKSLHFHSSLTALKYTAVLDYTFDAQICTGVVWKLVI